MVSGNWDDAACIGEPLSIFFSFRKRDQERAKGFCAVCPVRNQCLDLALDNKYSGIYGGYTERERNVVFANAPESL